MSNTDQRRRERQLWGKVAAYESWGRTVDRAARTAPGRRAFEQKFLDQAGGDPKRAEMLRRAYYARLSALAAESRRKAKAAREKAAEFEKTAADAEAMLAAAREESGEVAE